ncbi:MAG: hypothetical protein ACI4FZ_10410 [Lachnospiraceae bacterium]
MYQKTMAVNEAVNHAVDDCIAEDILAEFLTAHRAEVLHVYLAEVDEEVLRENLRAEGYGDGFSDGRQKLLTGQIEKKIKAGKTLEQIALEVEQPVEEIKDIYESLIAKKHAV